MELYDKHFRCMEVNPGFQNWIWKGGGGLEKSAKNTWFSWICFNFFKFLEQFENWRFFDNMKLTKENGSIFFPLGIYN